MNVYNSINVVFGERQVLNYAQTKKFKNTKQLETT